MRFIITGLKRPKFKKKNIQLKKKEFNYLYKDIKTNTAKVIVDKKFGELAVFFYTVIPTFQIYKRELILQFNQQKLILKNSYFKLVILQADPNNNKIAIITAIEDQVRIKQRHRYRELLTI